MNRAEKIKLLTSLQSGTIKITDVEPKKLSRRIGYSDNEKFSIDGKFVDEETFNQEEARQKQLFGPREFTVTIAGK